jgi:hypothetical protein
MNSREAFDRVVNEGISWIQQADVIVTDYSYRKGSSEKIEETLNLLNKVLSTLINEVENPIDDSTVSGYWGNINE